MRRTTRIIGHMVTRNEASRYLDRTITWLHNLTDGLVVAYDDCSDDGTYAHLVESGAHVGQRALEDTSFADDESILRGRAWQFMEETVKPTLSDWVLCVDADEFLLPRGSQGDARALLLGDIERAVEMGENAVCFDVAEVFGWDPRGTPLVRKDGFWGQIRACRLVRWRPYGRFSARREGCGSTPSSWVSYRCTSSELDLLHLGYARAADRQIRYARYRNGTGHNPRHIASILSPGRLKPWTGAELPT